MEIIQGNPEPKEIPYSRVEAGECFKVHGSTHIKGDYRVELGQNLICIDLSTGTCYDYDGTIMVIPVAAHIVLE